MKRIIILTGLLWIIAWKLYGQSSYNLNENRSWISSSTYNMNEQLTAAGVTYFNEQGKIIQTHNLDVKTGKIWASEVRYDEFGRPAFSTLSAPIGNNYGYKTNFIKKSNGGLFSQSDLYGLTSSQSSVGIGGYTNTLGWYYSNNNTAEPYQDITAYPYNRIIYSTLNPGSELRNLGGQKVRRTNSSPEEWVQSFSFTLPLAQELYYAFGTGYFTPRTAVNTNSGITVTPFYIMGTKQVVRDVHGVESVTFTDSDGRVLATARSGNEDNSNRKKYKVLSPIGEQGYVDIHIPVGCGGNVFFRGAPAARFKIYDLVADSPVSGKGNVSGSTYLSPGIYRIEEITDDPFHFNKHPYATILGNNLQLLDNNYNVGVEYFVNYYDYSLNFYDKAGQLSKSIQPLGFDGRLDLSTSRTHTLATTFTYNSLGHLLQTSSPDEGQVTYQYRQDGQLRFSQSSKQMRENEYSYTNYDALARPVENGVVGGDFATADPDVASFSGSRTEQLFTMYDEYDPSLSNYVHYNLGLNSSTNYKQRFLSGRVSKVWTQNPKTTTTWYSYDVNGRVEWMVQHVEGLGTKTIDYEYDQATGLVAKVWYQKHDNASDRFIHRYSYDLKGHLTRVETSTDNRGYTEQASYEYYETGELKRTVLAENAQGIDYVYNLNGQLKAINHPSRNRNLDPGNDGNNAVASDLFGMALDYYNGDYQRINTPRPVTSTNTGLNQFNGNIKAARWSNSSIAGGSQAGQVYSYNKNNWLQRADFGTAQNTGAIATGTDYQIAGIDYDANGNIRSLTRNKNRFNGNNTMDALTYNYNFYKRNQLTDVKDAVTITTNADDLKSQPDNNYLYNSIGQMEVNKQDKAIYQYNAAGLVTSISRIVNPTENTGLATKKPYTLFQDNFDEFTTPFWSINISLLKNYNWELLTPFSSMTHELGRDMNLERDCFVALEMPIARLVLDNNVKNATIQAGVKKLFDVIPSKVHTFSVDIIRRKSTGSSKGSGGKEVNSKESGNTKIGLKGIVNEGPGLGEPGTGEPGTGNPGEEIPQYPILIRVKTTAGEVIASKIIEPSSNFNSCNEMFLRQTAELEYTAPAEEAELIIEIINAQELAVADFYIDNVRNSVMAAPTVDFFYDDRGFRVRKEAYAGAYKEITYYVRDATGNPMSIITQPGGRAMNTEENPIYGEGRIGMYNRQSSSSLYELKDHLGNVRATFIKSGNAMATINGATDYYPGGMPMPNRQITAGAPYRYGYQGEFAETDQETGLPAFELRLYDPKINRWTTIDPYRQHPSPYMSMGNNWTNNIDPDGGYDFVRDPNGNIRWDNNVNSQEDACKGCTWLGTSLTFVFNSFIDDERWDGPMLDIPAGDKLTTYISIAATENAEGEMVNITAIHESVVGWTPIGTARNYYPGEGGDKHLFATLNESSNGTLDNFYLTFENHASVSEVEEYGMNYMGYKIVDVAQRLHLRINDGFLSVDAYTNVFPSATLDVQGFRLLHYKEPSFVETHKAPFYGYVGTTPIRDYSYYPIKFYKRN